MKLTEQKTQIELTDFSVELKDGEEVVTAEYYVHKNGEYLFYVNGRIEKRISDKYVVGVR